MKGYLIEREKISANSISDKGLIKIYKELIQLSSKNNPNNSIKKWAEELNRQF